MRLSWIRAGPKCNECPHKRQKEDRGPHHREEGDMKIEGEIEVPHLHAKAPQNFWSHQKPRKSHVMIYPQRSQK
jgi:hypothetical protein